MAVFDLRGFIRSGTPISQALSLAAEFAFSPPTSVNMRAIARDYPLTTDFYHRFLDTHYHLYSQCRFGNGDERRELHDPEAALKRAARRKLDHVWNQLNLRPRPNHTPRILDIGSGWGGVTRYVNELDLDVHVTSLTLSENHKKYVEHHHVKNRPHEVLLEDFLRHRRGEFYDAVVILGVIEHIPTYRLFCQRVWEVLKPDGRLYVDASATKEKFAANAFTRRYTWHGPHSCLALPDLVEELLFHGFRMVDVVQDSRDYERTMRAWALRLEANHDHIAATWGEYLYRAFRVFLWGGAHAFKTDRLQAYTLIAERGEDAGPRPGRARRTAQFLASLR
jgi:cyclopropane-fatty-acyl-phospholipid synthase